MKNKLAAPENNSRLIDMLEDLLDGRNKCKFKLGGEDKYYAIDRLDNGGYRIVFIHKINGGEQVFTYFLNAEGEPIKEVDPWGKEIEYVEKNKELIRGMIERVLGRGG